MNAVKASSRDIAAAAGPIGFLAVVAGSAVMLGRNFVFNLPQGTRAVFRARVAKIPPLPAGAFVAAAIMLGAVVAAMFLVDRAGADWARHLPHWVTASFGQITNAGLSGWFLVPFGTIVLCLAALASSALPRLTQAVLAALAARFGFLFLAIGAPGLFTTIVKRLIGRARPYVDLHGSPFTYRPFIWRPEYASLPSGHATTAVAAAVAIGALWPRSRIVMWLYALIVMVSRVVVLAHHPSDVIAGALVGAVGAAFVRRWFAARRMVFSPRDLRTLPGPSLGRIGAALLCAVRYRPSAEAPAIETDPAPPPQASVVLQGKPDDPRPDVSVVVPVRNEAGNIAPLVAEIAAALAGRTFEIVYVNDGSSDGTQAELADLMGERPWLRQIRHRQSCGQSAALRTGVAAARAPVVVTLDGDGQNDPAFIPALIATLEGGPPRIGLVAGQRTGRKATGFKRLQSRIANAVRAFVLRDGTRDTGCGLKAFRRETFLALPYFDGLHRFLPALVRREGFAIGYVDVVDRPRRHGVSNYGFWDRLWIGLVDLAGVWWLIRRRKRVPQYEEISRAR